jgi:hypothetical protein
MLHESTALAILISGNMQILFAISALCFIGILCAAIALARHIRSSRLRRDSDLSIVPDFKQHLFSASEVSSTHGALTRPNPIHQSVSDITANKQWTLPPQPIRMRRTPTPPEQPVRIAPTPRKSPQPARYGPMELIDSAYFNKDMGDLTDPYQPPRLRANDRSQPGPTKRS